MISIVATSILNEIGREVTVSRADDTMNISWLVVYLALWKMMEFVSWDDEIPNSNGKSSSSHVPVTNQYHNHH